MRRDHVIPLVSSAVMRECDAREVAKRGVQTLVRAAGVRVAHEAHQMLGSLYARRICVLVGPGLNGADGRVAARTLRARGSLVDEVSVTNQPAELRGYDLVIDAAFGLGCTRPYVAPHLAAGIKVLAVDLPSGVDADTGTVLGRPLHADVTLALGALKFAHVDGDAAAYAGELRFAGLGIAVPMNNALIMDDDLDGYVLAQRDDHKWTHALSVLAGSPRMPGAAVLVCSGALSAGASRVRLESKGEVASLVALPVEVVRVRGPEVDPRSRCVVAGPGLGTKSGPWLYERLHDTSLATVFDADALTPEVVTLPRHAPRVLTPHAGEFERLISDALGAQRIVAVRKLARETDCVVLLKGPLTIIANPDGRVRVVNSGTSALATAGSGDVLSGMIGAAIARGHDALDAAALSAHLHGRAGARLTPYQTSYALADAVRQALNSRSRDR
jgi:NAD(P)H-hydrate epimerase